MQRLYAIVLLAIGLMSMVAVFARPPEEDVPLAQASSPSETEDDSVASEAMLLKRDSSGQFHLTATLNGNDVRFLVDTGADMVALTEDEAQGLGLVVGEMKPIVQTAGGMAYGAPVMIEDLTVGGTELHNVSAVVVQGLSTNLLGQTVLRQLGGVSLQGDRMVIHPR